MIFEHDDAETMKKVGINMGALFGVMVLLIIFSNVIG